MLSDSNPTQVIPRDYNQCKTFFSFQDEIFDMVKPGDPLRITLQDLISRYAFGGTPIRAQALLHVQVLCANA